MRRKRQKRQAAVWWMVGAATGVLVAAGVLVALRAGRRGRVALQRDMRSLEKKVIRALREHRDAREQPIDVQALGAGVIELSGYVDTPQLAREVVALVDAVPGVHAVFNRLEIRSEEMRLEQNRRRGSGSGTRWYGGSVGIGRRRQNPATDPPRRDDAPDLKIKALSPNRDEVLSEVEEMEGTGVEIGISRPGPLKTDVPPGKPV